MKQLPIPPLHPGCRCIISAVTRLENLEEIERPAKEWDEKQGKYVYKNVPGSVSYSDWFERQSGDFQKEVLGGTKYALYKEGKVKFEQFSDIKSNKILTVNDLKTKYKLSAKDLNDAKLKHLQEKQKVEEKKEREKVIRQAEEMKKQLEKEIKKLEEEKKSLKDHYLYNKPIRGHYSKNDEMSYPEQYNTLAKDLFNKEYFKLSKEQTDEIINLHNGLLQFTRTSVDLRKAQKGKNDDPNEIKKANLIEKWLDLAPRMPTGDLWRGMRGKRGDFENLKKGDTYQLSAFSSTSTDKKIAMNSSKLFLNHKQYGKGVLLHIIGGTPAGSSVKFLSEYYSEKEVIISKRNVLEILSKREIKLGLNKEPILFVQAQLKKITPLDSIIIK